MQVRRADYSVDRDALQAIRFTVFVNEQGVPPEEEMDDRDPECIHVLALEGDASVGTGRIDIGAGGKIGRVAVLAERRSHGVGTALMACLHDIAREHGLEQVWCNAQTAARPFYERLGYRVTSGIFYEAGIEHVRMELRL